MLWDDFGFECVCRGVLLLDWWVYLWLEDCCGFMVGFVILGWVYCVVVGLYLWCVGFGFGRLFSWLICCVLWCFIGSFAG